MKTLARLLLFLSLAVSGVAVPYSISLDTQTVSEEQVIDRVFSGNTIMLQAILFENGTAASLTQWTNIVFHYANNRFVSSGTYQVTGTVSGAVVTFISTNVLAGADRERYWSVVADSSNGYKRTWGTGTMVQRYDPAAGNPSPISASITINFDNYTESGLISGVTITNATYYGDGGGLTNITGVGSDTNAVKLTGAASQTIAGSLIVTNVLNVLSDFNVNGDVQFSSSNSTVTILGQIRNIGGPIRLGDDVLVTGVTTVSNNLIVTGNITVSGTVDSKDIFNNAAMINEPETIASNWVNTTYPWADNEVADNITVTNYLRLDGTAATSFDPIQSAWFYLTFVDFAAAVPSSTNIGTVSDAVYEDRISGSTKHNQQIDLTWPRGFDDSPAYAVAPGAVATVDTNGYITHVSDGVATATVTTATMTNSATVTLATSATSTNRVYTSGVTNSVRSNACALVDGLLADSGNDVDVFSTYTPGGPSYVRNASCWAATLDLTPASPYNTDDGKLYGATLISTQHVVFAWHAPPAVGTVFHWVASDNSVETNSLTAVARIGSTDIGVGILSAGVANCTPAKIMPSDYSTYLPGLQGRYLPVVSLDQSERASVHEVGSLLAGPFKYVSHYTPQVGMPGRYDASRAIVTGDSSNPMFLFVSADEPILLGTHFTATWVPALTYYKAEINATMTSLGGSDQLLEADWSGYASSF